MPIEPPPPVLFFSRVLEYAVLDDSVGYVGHSHVYRITDHVAKEIGRVPCLAICEDKSDSQNSILLLFCDEDWSDLGSTGFASVSEARDWSERTYPGVARRWLQTHVSEEEAERYLDELFAEQRCSFCDRRPDQGIEKLLASTKNNTRICDRCIDEFHTEMHSEHNAS